MRKHILTLLTLMTAVACNNNSVKLFDAADFTAELDGKQISLYTIKSGDITAQITNYGGRVVSLWTPDRDGNAADVVIGYENIDRYIHNTGERFFGASPGPVANRIGGASFKIGDEVYELSKNDGNNTLHGGFTGIDNLVWDVVALSEDSITFSVLHPDGLDGFPGNKTITMTYSIADNALKVEFKAVTDKATPINLAHHSFFNLRGCGNGDILGHIVTINAGKTTPVNSELIPSGEIVDVEGTPLDFREPHAIGERIDADNEQIRYGHGYDHNWVIDRKTPSDLEFAASAYEPESGRLLEVYSDQPGMQFYSGYFFDGSYKLKNGAPASRNCSFAFETQKFPDSVNHDNFPGTIVAPGEEYTHTCIYSFSTK